MQLSPSVASTSQYVQQAPIYVEEQRTQSMTFHENPVVAQHIKEDLLDVVNDLKSKESWQLSED